MNRSDSRFNVLGVGIDALSLDRAVEQVLSAGPGARRGYVCFCTAHGLVEARRNAPFRQAYERACIAAPDGMPLVWLGRRSGHTEITRVYGPDLMLAACDRGRERGVSHYFYGGMPGVARELSERLQQRFPGLVVAGWRTAPIGEIGREEIEALRVELSIAKPCLLWIGLGAPKQELFMANEAAGLDAGLLLGVGAAFDFFSGRVRQAPRWIQRSGLEWLFRFFQEPRRLGKRYLVTTPIFAFCVLRQLALSDRRRASR